MYKTIIGSAAAILLTGSLANAQFLLGQDEFGHKQVRNLYAERSIGARQTQRRFAAPIPQSRLDRSTTTPRGVTPGFLILGSKDKRVTNQYSGYSWPR